MDLKEQEILGAGVDSHWYYQSKAKAVERLLSGATYQSILDVGAGSGFFTRHLLEHTAARRGLCVDINYEGESEERHADKPLGFTPAIFASDADLVLFMDVLEHVDNDVELLSSYVKVVRSGAAFLISVPAFQFLWSGHDVFLEHRRRYTQRQLEDVVSKAGLQIVRSSYYFGFVFPIAAAQRLAARAVTGGRDPPKSGLRRHHPITNAVLAALCRAELPLIGHNRLFGLSVFCLARKQKPAVPDR